MVNHTRGELALKLDGEVYTLCLTLGALGEIEAALKIASLSELFARLAEGRISSAEVSAILAAALKGGGRGTALLDGLSYAEAPGIVAELLHITFAPLMADA